VAIDEWHLFVQCSGARKQIALCRHTRHPTDDHEKGKPLRQRHRGAFARLTRFAN
jgi:hypothetical protein